jgi:hypothetical protein
MPPAVAKTAQRGRCLHRSTALPQAGRVALSGGEAQSWARDQASTIEELQAAGCELLRAIAVGLDERGIPAARGGRWSAVQVSRLLEAAGHPFDGASVAVA